MPSAMASCIADALQAFHAYSSDFQPNAYRFLRHEQTRRVFDSGGFVAAVLIVGCIDQLFVAADSGSAGECLAHIDAVTRLARCSFAGSVSASMRPSGSQRWRSLL